MLTKTTSKSVTRCAAAAAAAVTSPRRQDAAGKAKVVQLHHQAVKVPIVKGGQQERAGAEGAVHHAARVAVGQCEQRAAADGPKTAGVWVGMGWGER